MGGSLALDSWQDWASLFGIFSVLAVLVGVLASGYFNSRKAKTDDRAEERAEKAAVAAEADRADKEAERLVTFLTRQRDEYERALTRERADFEAKLLDQAAQYKRDLNEMRQCLERKIAALDTRIDTYGCENAPTCKTRRRITPSRRASGKGDAG
jgi:hypothetical protein